MEPERWQQVETLYHAALARVPEARAAFLDAACAGDAELRHEVESLLAYDEQAQAFIETPALEVAAKALAEDHAGSARKQQLGAYKIISQIGAGGMGEVYLAEDTRLGRKVALKLLPPLTADNEQARKRFIREARVAAKLRHPNICAIYEVNEADGVSFIAMQYIEGETLGERIYRRALKLGEALNIAIQIAEALGEAHAHFIIHRDIKPHNIIIDSRNEVKVLDFGLAKVVQVGFGAENDLDTLSFISAPGAIVGTVPYMSPEQVRGEAVDMRTDIFSFGIVLYEMVSGKSPFGAASRIETLLAVLHEEPPPLARFVEDVPDDLQRLVSKTLRKELTERYQTISEVLLDLKALSARLAPRTMFD